MTMQEKAPEKKIEEAIIIRDDKMMYAVRLKDKASTNCDSSPYIVCEKGDVKFVDRIYSSKNEFDFSNDVHAIAKEVFIASLSTSVRNRILELKQLELVFRELGLDECIASFRSSERLLLDGEAAVDA